MNHWDVSKVTDMSDLFKDRTTFNADISSWDTSAVTDMQSMFNGAAQFNGDISSWDTSAVTDMKLMFNGAVSFECKISSWDISSVTEIYNMFGFPMIQCTGGLYEEVIIAAWINNSAFRGEYDGMWFNVPTPTPDTGIRPLPAV